MDIIIVNKDVWISRIKHNKWREKDKEFLWGCWVDCLVWQGCLKNEISIVENNRVCEF
jgi:hypothetical protein